MQPALTLVLGDRFVVLSSYSTALYLAAAVTVLLALVIAARRDLPWRKVLLCLVLMALMVPIGARLLNAAINVGLYGEEPGRLLALEVSGFSLYGGLLLAAAVGLVASRWLALDVVRLADSAAPALGLGIAIVRLGCFAAGCCYGTETDLPWAVVFPFGSNAHVHQLASGTLFLGSPLPVHPTQLYEAIAGLGGAVLAAWLLRRRSADGVAFLAFVIWFSAARWLDYYFRVQPAGDSGPEWLYPALYGAVIVLCASLLARRLPSGLRQRR